MMHDVLFLLGFGLVAAAAFSVSVPLGMVVLGVPMIVVSLSKKRMVDK